MLEWSKETKEWFSILRGESGAKDVLDGAVKFCNKGKKGKEKRKNGEGPTEKEGILAGIGPL